MTSNTAKLIDAAVRRLERVPALAEALEIDPALLFRMALSELWPGYERIVVRRQNPEAEHSP